MHDRPHMTIVVPICRTEEDLDERVSVTIELPRFAVRALEYRADVMNAGAEREEDVTFNDVIEWFVISPLSVRELPRIEHAVPGFSGALARWILETNYVSPGE